MPEREKGALDVHDCVFLIIGRFVLKTSPSIRTGLQTLLSNLLPDQTSKTLIIKDLRQEAQITIDFFMKCVEKLGRENDSPLMPAQ